MSATDILFNNSPIHGLALTLGWFVIAVWIATAFWFIFVAVVHQIQRLVRARLEDDLPDFRTGGLVSKRQLYVIGERGPERVRPPKRFPTRGL